MPLSPSLAATAGSPRSWGGLVSPAGILLLLVLLAAVAALFRDAQPGRHASQDPSRVVPTASSSSAATTDRADAATRPERAPPRPSTEARSGADKQGRGVLVQHNVTIRNLDGKVVFRGDVDLASTLRRIDEGRRLAHRNDGAVFQNRERRLPSKPRGYYREYVHPTPDLSGPGPQRVVVGEGGEVFYTADHYRTFRRVR